jgi:hypothetical protein
LGSLEKRIKLALANSLMHYLPSILSNFPSIFNKSPTTSPILCHPNNSLSNMRTSNFHYTLKKYYKKAKENIKIKKLRVAPPPLSVTEGQPEGRNPPPHEGVP